jgi:putative colanic acid biosysnthesis UDP-glucose lipid carrier transferase
MLAGVGNQQSLLRGQLSLLGLVRMTLDPILIVGAFIACTLAWGETFDGPDLVLALIVFSLTFPGHVSLVGNWWTLLKEILTGWSVIVLILLFFGYATKYFSAFNPIVLISWVALVPVILYVAHRAVPVVLPKVLAIEGYRSAVIAGFTEPGRKLAQQFASTSYLGVHVMGFFDDRAPARVGHVPDYGLKGRLGDLPAYVKANRVEAIFVALPMASQPRILKLLDELRDTTASIYFVPDILLTDLIQARMDDINGIPVVAVCETPFYGVNGLVKRLEDVIVSLMILLAISPLMLAIALALKLTSPGPLIFRQRRYGLDGKEIIIYKFRSMTVTEDGDKQYKQVTKDDDRVTRFGAFLRKTSLDELPQFFNVLQGRMSIVGPRPHAIAVNEQYRKLIPGYMVRHKVKPGITGWAQINGHRGGDDLEHMRKRIEFDLQYLRNWSLQLDIGIMLRTALIMLRGDQYAY